MRALVNEFANSWNQHDMKGMHELDTEDVEWINVVGHYWRGKDTVYKGHTAIHKGMEAKSVMKVESVTVLHFVKSAPDYPSTTDTKTRGSYTMVKRDGIWKIVHFQNTVIDPNAEKDDLPKFADTGFPPPGHPLYVSTPK